MQRVNSPTAYLLWGLCIFGVCGIQRLYTGRILSGIIYLLTFGIFGIGQLVDLLLIPGMVSERNHHFARLRGTVSPLAMPVVLSPMPQPVRNAKEISPMQKLLRAASENGGVLSPAQVALYTELEPEQLQTLLHEAERLGYFETTNDPKTGAIRYQFDL